MEKNEIGTIIDKLIIVPDTNILLYLYKCSFNTSQNIVDLLGKVKEKIIIPSRVYKEYLNHKDEEQGKIDRKYDSFTKNLKKQVNELKGKINGSISESRKYDFPDCDVLETGIGTFLDKIILTIEKYENSLSAEKQNKSVQIANVAQLIRYWNEQGKIKSEPTIVQLMEYIKEGEFRFRYKMPPGYKDEEEKDKEVKKDSKKDNFEGRIRKYGDLFVWKEIIDIGKERKDEYLIFLTNDVKEDWWVLKGEENNKVPVSMREELRKEYMTITGSDKIEFMTLSKFYELFSDYYKICDIKTTLELDYESYVQGQVHTKYQEQIEEEIIKKLETIDWGEISGDFVNIIEPDIDIDDVFIEKITIHYDDDGETAIYDIKIGTTTLPIEIRKNDGESVVWIAEVELKGTIFIQIQRDLRNLDESGISFKSFSYDVLSNRDSWEIPCEMEEDALSEAKDTLEDYYNH
ncbi:PIN-like domain-containing protein [Dorea amylophila]|uniref:PIN-like domain-containing protein n=1 Tax=Dorea amylophila TaxID=2981789 RepID=UPI0022E8423D|nr:PIN-like domain-containing protein [Dorea amylophila]